MNATLDIPSTAPIPAASSPPIAAALTLEATLIGIESARLALRCSENRLLSWIASGELEWAFDLRAKESSRAYIRIFTQSVVKFQDARKPANLRRNWRLWLSGVPSFDDVFASIFRHRRPCIRSTELSREWNCGCSHVTNLIDMNLLELAEKNHSGTQSRVLSRKSVADFMQQRRIQ